MTDLFRWAAIYGNGETLPEVEPDGTEHGWSEVDLGRLVAFALVPQQDGLPSPLLKVSGDSRPIFFRRRTISLDPETSVEQKRITVSVLGWQRTVRGESVKAFAAFFEDGSVLVSDRDEF